jgi:hypothetical protein
MLVETPAIKNEGKAIKKVKKSHIF